MRNLWIHLLLLAVTATARYIPKSPSFPGDLYPANLTRNEFKLMCPRLSDKIDYCVPQYKECTLKLSSSGDCENQFCLCVKISDRDENQPAECHAHNASETIRINGNKYRKSIIEQEEGLAVKENIKKLKPLLDAQNKMVDDCGIESKLEDEGEQIKLRLGTISPLLNWTMPFFALANIELPKTEKCEYARLRYLEKCEEVDAKTSETLKIPYNMWFIGAEFGPVGRVLSRLFADGTCDKSSSEFNHHSVTRVNCYDQQRGVDKCDEEFSKSVNRTLSTLDSKKVQCKMFIGYIKRLQQLRSNVFYTEAAGYHVDASKVSLSDRMLTEGFKADNQSLTQRDTKTTIVSFESTEHFSPLLQQHFDEVSSECSNSRNSADIVASCGFQYGQCILQQRQQCKKQLNICLSNIPEMSKSCEEAYRSATGHLWPSTPPTQESEVVPRIESIKSDWSIRERGILIGLLVAIGAGVIIVICCCVMKESCCRKHAEQKLSENEDHSTTGETKNLLDSPPISETSSEGSGTNTPSETSPRTPPNLPDPNKNAVQDSVSLQGYTDLNNENISVIPSVVENNQPTTSQPMKYDEPMH